MSNRRIPVRPAIVAPHIRRDGTFVRGYVRAGHARRPPRVVDVAEAYVSSHWTPGYLRKDGRYVFGHMVEGHARQAHRRGKPQR